MEKLRVGIAGFGRIGAEHARWLSACESAAPVAVADATPQRRTLAESRGLRTVQSLDALLDDETVDAILIATPTSLHFEQASTALLAGKHVMIEKPMALDLAQAKELVDLAHKQQRVLSVFHCRRWDRDYLTVKQAIESGTFGKIINVESRIGQWASCVGPAAREWRPQWRNEASFGGGGLYDWGSHLLDQLWRLLAPARPTSVFAQLRGNVWSRDCDDFVRICINFDSGAVGLVEINTTTTRPLPRWHIDGTSGSAESPYSLEYDVEQWARLEFSPADIPDDARPLPLSDPGHSETEIWDRFAAAVRGEDPPAVTSQSVLPTMALLDAARESSRTGHSIAIQTNDWTS